MKIVNEGLLKEMRSSEVCHWCGRVLRNPAHPHHLFARQMGGGGRLDIRENLIALGGPFDCDCHGRHHYSGQEPTFEQLLHRIAHREGMSADHILDVIYRLRRSCGGRRVDVDDSRKEADEVSTDVPVPPEQTVRRGQADETWFDGDS